MLSLQLLLNTGTCLIQPVLCFKLIKYLFSATELLSNYYKFNRFCCTPKFIFHSFLSTEIFMIYFILALCTNLM